jgi:hypothetical protein
LIGATRLDGEQSGTNIFYAIDLTDAKHGLRLHNALAAMGRLGETLGLAQTADQLAELAVTYISNECTICLTDTDGVLRYSCVKSRHLGTRRVLRA